MYTYKHEKSGLTIETDQEVDEHFIVGVVKLSLRGVAQQGTRFGVNWRVVR